MIMWTSYCMIALRQKAIVSFKHEPRTPYTWAQLLASNSGAFEFWCRACAPTLLSGSAGSSRDKQLDQCPQEVAIDTREDEDGATCCWGALSGRVNTQRIQVSYYSIPTGAQTRGYPMLQLHCSLFALACHYHDFFNRFVIEGCRYQGWN